MNYFRLLVAILTTVSVVSAAAHPEPKASEVCRLTEADRRRLNEIIRAGDDAEALADRLGGRRLEYSTELLAIMENLMARQRPQSLDVLLDHINFRNAPLGDAVLNHLLGATLHYSFIDFADLLLDRNFNIMHRIWVAADIFDDISVPPWNLVDFKDLISRHPEHAARIMPTSADMAQIETVEQALALIELALHCDAENVATGGNQIFDPSSLLYKGLLNNRGFNDAEMAQVAQRLLDLGADTAERAQALEYLRGHHPDYEMTYGIIDSFVTEDIKEPEFD